MDREVYRVGQELDPGDRIPGQVVGGSEALRVLHVTGIYPPAGMGGPPKQFHRLGRELRTIGVDVRVVTTNNDGPRTSAVTTDRWRERDGVPVYYARRLAGTDHSSWGDWRALAGG